MSYSTASAGAPVAAKNPAVDAFDWKENTISPVTNPIYFEDPVIRSEIRPIFIYHNFDNQFVVGVRGWELFSSAMRSRIALPSSRRRTDISTSMAPE